MAAALRELEDKTKYKKVEFSHGAVPLAPEAKQKQVEELIIKYAMTAQTNKGMLEELVKTTCLKRCINYKIGLKYNPDSPNKKALTRIKEKMFFAKEEAAKSVVSGSVREVLQREETEYLRKVDDVLEKRENVLFEITDMVRGKCVFLEVADIIETVNDIKRFVEEDNRYGIGLILSRFTNKIPISDVTLKIVVNNEIAAELQLTVQTNAAAYSFAHRIYELQRTKVFSKLKIVHNYFE